MENFGLTPSQTVGPYFKIGLEPLYRSNLIDDDQTKNIIHIKGTITDGNSEPISDAVIEIWQANALGEYSTTGSVQDLFQGFGRCATNESGEYQFTTIKPGQVPYKDGSLQAPHIAVNIQMRGLLQGLVTRLYFEDESLNNSDPVLTLVPKHRRVTLVAKKQEHNTYVFNIAMQGDLETVFFYF